MRLIDADALCKRLQELVGSPEGDDKLIEIDFAIIDAPTIDAIPIDWLERRLNETAEETARGDDQTELNNAIFQVLVEWEKERRENGEAGH